jgi:RNA polymerase sigma factor (sigma-70 family)
MSDRTDEELVDIYQKGNEGAFNELVLRYQEKVYWVARRFSNDHDNADDITQEVFCKVYEGLKDFRGESSLFTWLYRVTVNVSLNYLRRLRVREFFSLDDLLELAGDEAEAPDRVFERQEQKTLIAEAIATLPVKQRAVFVLRYYEEIPYEEIAKILGTTVGGLKANYFHAVRKVGDYVNRAHRTR